MQIQKEKDDKISCLKSQIDEANSFLREKDRCFTDLNRQNCDLTLKLDQISRKNLTLQNQLRSIAQQNESLTKQIETKNNDIEVAKFDMRTVRD